MGKFFKNWIKFFDIHGSAKWASYEEIKKSDPSYLKPVKSFELLRDNSASCILVLGPKGAGKSKFVIPNLLKFKGSVLIFRFDRN